MFSNLQKERRSTSLEQSETEPPSKETLPSNYKALVEEIKSRVLSSQLKAALSINHELIELYWEIGSTLHKKQQIEGWGSKVVERLAKDLRLAFPDMKGFSLRNLRFMVQFAREYTDTEIVKQLVSQIPWGHNILLLQRLSKTEERVWYAKKTVEHGWSRAVLDHQVESKLHRRQGRAITNFRTTIPSPQSELAQQTLKDPFNFDFLRLTDKALESDIEQGLVDHIRKFLLELGAGFAFMGNQVPLTVGNTDYYLDLLFYHVKLKRYIVIELKATKFTPSDAGQLNFYLSAVDDLFRDENDNPSIGILLCKTKDRFTAEYALRDINKPMGVAGYEIQLVESLPSDLKGTLPTIEELEAEFEGRALGNLGKDSG